MRNTIKIILPILIAISIQAFAFGQVAKDDATHTEDINATEQPEESIPIDKQTQEIPEDYVVLNPESNFIENFVKNLEEGRLIYNPPENMTFNITEQINATIAKGESSGEPIKIAPIMEVDLKGFAFDIVPITDRRQFIASDGPTVWKWDVNPRKIGNHTLDLSAYVIITMPDGNEERRALVKSKTIHIFVNPDEKKERLGIIPELFTGQWAKPLAGLFAALAFIITFFKDDILAWIRSRKKQNERKI